MEMLKWLWAYFMAVLYWAVRLSTASSRERKEREQRERQIGIDKHEERIKICFDGKIKLGEMVEENKRNLEKMREVKGIEGNLKCLSLIERAEGMQETIEGYYKEACITLKDMEEKRKLFSI